MTAPHKPTAGFWITVALVAVLVGYPLSFGPACWMNQRTGMGGHAMVTIYGPLVGLAGSLHCERPLYWYACLGIDDPTLSPMFFSDGKESFVWWHGPV